MLPSNGTTGWFVDGNFRVDSWLVQPSLNTVSLNGTEVRLEPKVMAVLVCLAHHPGETLPKEELIRTVWPDTFVVDDVLVRAISELRHVFEDDPKDPHYIRTIAKRGYRLLAPVVAVNTSPGPRSPELQGTHTQAGGGDRKFGIGTLAFFAGIVVLVSLVAIFRLGRARDRLLDRSQTPAIRSLAVLPLKSLSDDPEQKYFTQAMTEELITDLSQISALKVISRTSSES